MRLMKTCMSTWLHLCNFLIFGASRPRNAQCLGAYIVDLTVILHNLFMTTLATQPPRAVTRDLLKDTINGYKIESGENHRRISSLPGPPIHFETKVKELIYELFKYS